MLLSCAQSVKFVALFRSKICENVLWIPVYLVSVFYIRRYLMLDKHCLFLYFTNACWIKRLSLHEEISFVSGLWSDKVSTGEHHFCMKSRKCKTTGIPSAQIRQLYVKIRSRTNLACWLHILICYLFLTKLKQVDDQHLRKLVGQ